MRSESHRTRVAASIDRMEVAAFQVPTDAPESDGTAEWDRTTVVVVHAHAGDATGLGWSYASASAAEVIRHTLVPVLSGRDAFSIEASWQAMADAVRNMGRPGIASAAISAVDVALWDLKARLLDLPLVDLFGRVRDSVELYGSGGFTSYDDSRLADQLGGWAGQGFRHVKMKVGRNAGRDPNRLRLARRAIGDDCELFVDANGAYARKQAVAMADRFAAEADVRWFEEPVSSDDVEGLRLLRDRAPAAMEIAAGEYGYTPSYFRAMFAAGAVDVLQADATRCGGFTGFLKASALCEAFHLPLSAHCGPQLHAHVGCACRPLRHVEYFHDQARLEPLLFDGVLAAINGRLTPDRSRVGHGISLREADASKFAV